MLRILKNLRAKDWGALGISMIFIVAQVWLDLKMPDYMRDITQLVQTEGSRMGDVLNAGWHMMVCAFGSLASAAVVGFFASRIAAGMSMRLRAKVYHKTMSFSMEEINNFSTSSLITRSTNDITQIQMFIAMGMQAMIKAPILAIWAICKIADKSWQWTAVTGGAVLILMIVITIVIVIALPRFRSIQSLTDNLNRVTRENLSGIRVVRAYNAEKYQEEKFEGANKTLTDTNLFVNRMMAGMMPIMSFLMSGMTLAIYWIGVYLIDEAEMMDKIHLFSDMVIFSSYSMQVILAFMLLAMIFFILPRASVSAKRINEVLDMEIHIKDGTVTKSEIIDQGQIEFRDVTFRYPDAADNVLEHISFTAKKGETVAFIGATGSGKTTLINLVPRFYDVTEGEILVDGINVKDYTQEALRNKLGYVPQKSVMFRGTVASNVAYGENGRAGADESMIQQAIQIAQATEFVDKMTDTYHAPIAQGGTNISGGQKQRLSIARAVCRRPEIYIFDDSFSALDYKTDRILRSALKEETGGTTTLIVAQRIGTILDADKIIVLEEGKIAGMGTHKELLNNCEVYREIAESQLTKEEIENA